MNGKLVTRLMLAVALVVYASQALSEDNLESLRGMTAIEANSATPEPKKWKGKSELIVRDFVQQPPLIPHKSQGFKTNLKGNKCIGCHGPADYEEAEATGISESHFRDRDGNLLADVSASWYFCTQCHVEQRDVALLVDNEFKSARDSQ